MHVIRLRGPWEVIDPDSGAICRVSWPLTPDAIPIVGSACCLTFLRRFHRPTGIEPHEMVTLLTSATAPITAASLNASPLWVGTHVASVEITELLQERNLLAIELQIDLEQIQNPAASILDVQLRISS